MRETFSSLLQYSQNYVVDASSVSTNGLSDATTFLKHEVNNAVRFIVSIAKEYKLQPLPQTASTVKNQIYYHYPPGMNKLETVKVTVGTISPPLKCIESQEEWDVLQQLPNQVSIYPQAYFCRKDDFGIYPTPQDVYTITLTGTYNPNNMTVADYTLGTISATNNSLTLTGAGIATFDATMVNRWFSLTDANGISNGSWYRIGAYTSPTVLSLETYFQETTGSALTYLIGQSPEIPSEMHEFIPYRAAAVFYATRRKDPKQAQTMMNMFYTGDFDNTTRRGTIRGGILGVIADLKERGRNNSQVVQMGEYRKFDLIKDNIWGVTLSAPSG